MYKLARLELGRFVRLVTGHNNLNWFQNRIGLWHSAECRFCGHNEETFVHLITECPSFWQTRRELFLDRTPQADMTWSVRALLDFTYVPCINDAFEGTWAHSDPLDEMAGESVTECSAENSSDS